MFFSHSRQSGDDREDLIDEIADLKQQLQSLDAQKNDLEETLASSQEERDRLQHTLEEKDQCIMDSEKELDGLKLCLAELFDHSQSALEISQRFQEIQQKQEGSSEDNRIHQVLDSTHIAADSIKDLSSQITNISEFVTMIKDISDQTGLLALNATIEAARAGEEGRGFMIVADEVNKLSEKTQKAVLDIKVIIESVNQSVSHAEEKIVQSSSELDSLTQNGSEEHSQQGLQHQLSEKMLQISEHIKSARC